MKRIVIFGTGSSAERAWRRLSSLEDVEIVACSDNDPGKHGHAFHDVPIRPPSELHHFDWDYVVVASQWFPQIREQLTDMGLDSRQILAANAENIREELHHALDRDRKSRNVKIGDGREVLAGTLPRVLILTCETLNQSHGTGVVLKRFFSDFPSDQLFSLAHLESGNAWLENSAVIGHPDNQVARRIEQVLRAKGFLPDVVYATAFTEPDLSLLAGVLDVIPAGTPVIQHFHDYMPHDAEGFDRAFRGLIPEISALWALTRSLQNMLSGKFAASIDLVPTLRQALPREWRQKHVKVSREFKVITLGNFWQPWMLPFLRDVWKEVRKRFPGLGPIEWYAHPNRVQTLIESGHDPGLEIVWRGFVPNVQERLRAADLALIPFNTEAVAANDYARYSLPSRVSELASAGLPLVAISSPDTELARFILEKGIGRVCRGPDPGAVVDSISAFISDTGARSKAGLASRALAETEFRIEPFREWFTGKFVSLSEKASRRGVFGAGAVKPLVGSESIPRAQLSNLMTDRIHYACGKNVIEGWLNVDGFDESYPMGSIEALGAQKIFRMDLTRPHPFPDASFRFGYSEDFLEHLDQADAIIFLSEAYRTLKREGVLRLSFPGIEGVLKRHYSGRGLDAGLRCREEAYDRWMHRHFFSYDEIQAVAAAVGFSAVRRCQYGEGSIPELIQENRPDQADLNLVVELVR